MNALSPNPWILSKQVNDGPNQAIGSFADKDEAIATAHARLAFHLERCPKDRVELIVANPWEVIRIHNGDTV